MKTALHVPVLFLVTFGFVLNSFLDFIDLIFGFFFGTSKLHCQ